MSKIDDCVKKHKDGALLDIFVSTGAKASVFPSGYNQWRKRVELKVCSEAKENKANMEVIEIVAKYFNKSTKDVAIVSGEKNREKTLLIKYVSADWVIKKVDESL